MKLKTNLFTLMRIIAEQKRENDGLRSAVSDLMEKNRQTRLAAEIRKRQLEAENKNLQEEVDYYKQKVAEKKMVAADEIEAMIKFYANGGVET